MKIYILAKDVYLDPVRVKYKERIVTVFISKNENLKRTNFRCTSCGRIAFTYSGDLASVFDGAAITKEKASFDVMCSRCGIIYRVL